MKETCFDKNCAALKPKSAQKPDSAQKHCVLLCPHEAMVDCAKKNNIFLTVVDVPQRRSFYKNFPAENCLFFDIFDVELAVSLLQGLDKRQKIDALITLTEKALPLAAQLCARLGLQGLSPDVTARISDKQKMRDFLAADSDYAVRYASVRNIGDIADFAAKTGFPIIVKPKTGAGSQGVVKLRALSDAENLPYAAGLIAEEFLRGEEYSVECFSFSGEHKICAITKKILINGADGDNFTEIGHCLPAELAAEQEKTVRLAIIKFLDSIGIDNGASHTEIKIFGDKVKIIETHNRIGGDRISALVKLSADIDLVEWAILWPLGLCVPPEGMVNAHGGAAIRFFTPPCGRLLAIDGAESLNFSPNVIAVEIEAALGTQIHPIEDSTMRCGFVIATGKNAETALENAEKAAASVRWTVE